MASKDKQRSNGTLKETAREIGSKLGEVHVTASRMVEGVKAAVKAGRAALSGKAKPKKATKKATKKSRSSRTRKTK